MDDGSDQLSEKDAEEHHEIEGAVRSEGLVDRSEPADVRGRREQETVENGESEHGATAFLNEQSQAAEDIQQIQQAVDWSSIRNTKNTKIKSKRDRINQSTKFHCLKALLTHPNVVEHADHFLELDGNFHVDVLVEARLDTKLFRQRGPIVADCR